MANNRLSAALAAAVLACCCSVGAFAESASSDSASEPVSVDSATVQPETASSPDLSDTALSADTRYSVDEITEILKVHPNAFQTAADPASSAADHADQTAEDSTQTVADSGTIWLKPFNDYTPAEGYLLLLTVIALSGAAIKLIKYLWL